MRRRFDNLVDEHGPRLLQLARLLLRSNAEAEDVVQDCLVKLWHHLPDLRVGAELGWLITCTRNACLDRLRGHRRRQGLLMAVAAATENDPAPGFVSPDQAIEARQQAQRLHAAIAAMPEPGRSLLILRDIQEVDVATVSKTLSLTENQVKVYTFRARRALRRRLEEEVHEQVA
ncbi:MAG: RNA polymerase sigma factor [Wenzhouxiangella sp.]